MTPKEKAIELVEKYMFMEVPYYVSKFEIKLCAIIAVNEIIKILNNYWNQDCKINNTKIAYYEEVKKEIELL